MFKIEHKEWENENTLTAPEDREIKDKLKLGVFDQFAVELTNIETQEAMKVLNNKEFVRKFPSVERKFADPSVELQRYGLISFIPAKGATPNENGVYGYSKLRGNFASTGEADERAEYLIRKVDSYHQIYHTYVGRPFPLTVSSNYSADTTEIDIRKDMTSSVSANIKQKKKDEQKIIEELEDQEEKLLEDVKKEEEDPYDAYTTLRVKLAQVSWTYMETEKKMKEMEVIIIKSHSEIYKMEKESSEYKKQYYSKYMKAREASGIKESKNTEETFMKFLVEDAKFDFLPNNSKYSYSPLTNKLNSIKEN